MRLSSLRRIHEYADLGLERLTHRLERQLVGSREAEVGFVSGGVDRDLSRLDSPEWGWLRSFGIPGRLLTSIRRQVFSQHERR